MEISGRLEDALVEYLKTKTKNMEFLMAQAQAEMDNRKAMIERLTKMLGRDGVVIEEGSDIADLIFGDDDDEDSGS
jgi:hypothetical protein